jgi:hypothetical protein
MNHYTQLLYYIKQLAEEDDLVNTVTKGDFDALDLEKQNIFPLVHINISGGGFTNGSTVLFNVQIGCFDIRDINKEVIGTKFWQQDNEVDNHNTTLAILNRMWLKMYVDFEAKNITASENPTFEIQTFTRRNLLDGWILTFEVEMPNEIINLCEPD